jgi:hypothetical protein
MKYLKLFFLFVSMALFSSCDLNIHTVEKAEDIGHHVFAILEDLDDINVDVFRSHFLTVDEYHSIAKTEGLSKIYQNKLKSTTAKEHDERIDNYYDKLVSKSSKPKIRWSQIEYEDFQYEIETKNGLKMCYGQLIFRYDDERYTIKINAIHTKEGYGIHEILKPKKEKD